VSEHVDFEDDRLAPGTRGWLRFEVPDEQHSEDHETGRSEELAYEVGAHPT
jgi:hypothetical protein